MKSLLGEIHILMTSNKKNKMHFTRTIDFSPPLRALNINLSIVYSLVTITIQSQIRLVCNSRDVFSYF